MEKKSDSDETYDVQNQSSTAPGSLRDQKNHQGYEVVMDQFSPLLSLPVTGSPSLERFRDKEGGPITVESQSFIKSHNEPKKKMKMTLESLPRIVT